MSTKLACPSCKVKFLVPAGAISGKGRLVRCAKCKHKWHAIPEMLITDDDEERVAETAEPSSPPSPAPEEGADDDKAEEDGSGSGSEGDASGDDSREEVKESADVEVPKAEKSSPAVDREKRKICEQELKRQRRRITRNLLICLALLSLLFVCTAFFAWREAILERVPAAESLYDAMGYPTSNGLVLADITIKRIPMGRKNRYYIKGSIVNTSLEPRKVPILRIRLVDKEGNVLQPWSGSEDAFLQPGHHLTFSPTADSAFIDSEYAFIIDIGNALELADRE